MPTKNRSEGEQAMNNLVEIFCDVDDFCRFFIPQWMQFCLDNKGYLNKELAEDLAQNGE
ncbi:hypothetical protein SAMN05421784_10149 [Xenorhabdus koppenhoeferi]|uniref:Transposase n=1 Tax=Xenorhabdus koppenhoeferi TaxID=351659 RepID=A0A1I7ESL7_9GAMM|nr:hypothetical protein SAMN05421784_10149 [Xenorhabdus koppenhoeferi]